MSKKKEMVECPECGDEVVKDADFEKRGICDYCYNAIMGELEDYEDEDE